MRPFKENTRRDQVYSLLSRTPMTSMEIANQLSMSISNTAKCLVDIEKRGLARRTQSNGKNRCASWIRIDAAKHKTTAEPVTIDNPPVTTSLAPADVSQSLGTGDAINVLIQTEQQNINYRHTLQQILSVYEQLGHALAAADLLED